MADKNVVFLFVVVVLLPDTSSEPFPDSLNVKLFTSWPLFVAVCDQQGVLGAYSSLSAGAPPQNPTG